TLLDRQALGAVRLSLAKNVAYNVVNEKTTYGLLKALSNMYEKPSASNKVFLIQQLVNTKMNEGASITDHVNKFNSILSRLMSVDIKFDDEVQALLLLSSLPESWSSTITAWTDRADGMTEGRKQNRNKSKSWKIGEIKDKEVNMAAGDYDDALVCCVENTIDDRIMDSGASFHATYCKEELERFKLRSGKVRLADDKTLDIAGVGDVVLKTSFGTSWTLKDVRYIPGLKKRLISVGQLDEEGYHVGFGDQQWKVTKGSLVVARGNKRGSLYMVEVPSDRINASIDRRGNAALWHQRLGHMSKKGMKILALKGRIPDLQKVVVGFCKPCVLGKQKKVFNTFKKWKAAVENETNLWVKCLKSDNGGEYRSSIYSVWNRVDTSYPSMWDTAYWGFLGVRTTLDIFKNILLLYCEYGVLSPLDTAYWSLSFCGLWQVQARIRRIFLMDTAYWSSE
ncbi:putative RNA-directed DNA polymerase, partial [Tanacetum coccineum]